MKTPDIIEGLQILQKYRTKPDGHHCAAEHDILHVLAPERSLSVEDYSRLMEIGWMEVGEDWQALV